MSCAESIDTNDLDLEASLVGLVDLATAATGDDGDEQRGKCLFNLLTHQESSVGVADASQWILAPKRVMSPPQ